MANRLKMATVHSIQELRQRGWSQRRIARTLGIHRDTVARYVRLAGSDAESSPTEPSNLITGSILFATSSYDGPGDSKQATVRDGPPGPDGNHSEVLVGVQNRPNLITGSTCRGAINSGPASRSEPYREEITAKLEQGLSAQRIWQDLVADHGFTAGYQSVQRFVRGLRSTTPLPFRRMECEPGEEAQVDFGTGAWVVTPEGEALPVGVKSRRRRTHVFRIVLSHSRKAYSEVVYRQTTDDFIRCLENAFHHFGGVPKTLVVDNLKAAVIKADWYDPELNPKLRSFCLHYGTVVLPTKPRMPRHKGKTERGIAYVQSNALKGRTFPSLDAQNRHLLDWEANVADTRIHGTTRRQVKKTFQEVEQPLLQPLPVGRFPCFKEACRKVGRDGHIQVDQAYYSVPPEYLGWRVWARWDGRVVRVFNNQFTQIAIHPQREPGRFRTDDGHVPREKRSKIERGVTYLLNRVGLIGPCSEEWAEQMLQHRGIEGVRVLMGLLSLADRHSCEFIEQACEIAATHGAYRLRTIRELLKRGGRKQKQFEFMDKHPIIRSLNEYNDLVHTAITKEPWR